MKFIKENTIPCHSRCKHQCGKEQRRESWLEPHRPVVEPPALPLSPAACSPPKQPQLHIFISKSKIIYSAILIKNTHTHTCIHRYITSVWERARESTSASDDLSLSSHGWMDGWMDAVEVNYRAKRVAVEEGVDVFYR
jgi:hypothetical protein